MGVSYLLVLHVGLFCHTTREPAQHYRQQLWSIEELNYSPIWRQECKCANGFPSVAFKWEFLSVWAGSNDIKYVPVKPQKRLGRNWSLEKGSELTRVTQAIEAAWPLFLLAQCFPSTLPLPPPETIYTPAPPPQMLLPWQNLCFSPGCFNCYPMKMLAGLVTEHSLDHERGSAYSCTPDLAGEGPSCHLQPAFGSKTHRMRRPGNTMLPKATLLLWTGATA